MSDLSVNMFLQEDEESQIDPLPSLNSLQMDHISLIPEHPSLPEKSFHSNSIFEGQKEHVQDNDSGAIRSDGAESFTSVVEDTQFVNVEDDTQPTNAYDLSQPSSIAMAMAIDADSRQSSAPFVTEQLFIGRSDPDIISTPEFKFSKAPDPKTSMNLQRQPPGKVNISQDRQVSLNKTIGDQERQMSFTTSVQGGHSDIVKGGCFQQNTTSKTIGQPTTPAVLHVKDDEIHRRDTNNSNSNNNSAFNSLQNISNNSVRETEASSASLQGHAQISPDTCPKTIHVSQMRDSTILGKPFAGLDFPIMPKTARISSVRNSNIELDKRNRSTKTPPKIQPLAINEMTEDTNHDVESTPSNYRHESLPGSAKCVYAECSASRPGFEMERDIEPRMQNSVIDTLVEVEGNPPNHLISLSHHVQDQRSPQSAQPSSSIESLEQQTGFTSKNPGRKRLSNRPLTEEELKTKNATQSPVSRAQRPFKVDKSARSQNGKVALRRNIQEGPCTPRGMTLTNSSPMPEPMDVLTTSWQLFQSQHDQLEKAYEIIEKQNQQVRELNGSKAKLEKQVTTFLLTKKKNTAEIEDLQRQTATSREQVSNLTKEAARLEQESEKLQTERDALREEASSIAQETTARIRETEIKFSDKGREEGKEEGRLVAAGLERVIELLRKDLDCIVNDCQHEKGIIERLQKQLEDRMKSEEVLKALVVQQQTTFTEQLDHKLALMSKGSNRNYELLEECLELMRGFKNSDPHVHQKMEELLKISKNLSENVQTKFEVATDHSDELRKAGENIIIEFKNHIEMLKVDKEKETKLNAEVAQLYQKQAGMTERLENRETKLMEMNNEMETARHDLAKYQKQMTDLTNELQQARMIVPEDPLLRVQLIELKIDCSNLRKEIEIAQKERIEAREELHRHTVDSKVTQHKLQDLSASLQQAEAKVFSSEKENLELIKSHEAETERLRADLQYAIQARSHEEDDRHQAQLENLQQEKSQAEAQHSSEVHDLTQRYLQAETRHSIEIMRLEELKSHSEELCRTQAVGFETQKLQSRMEVDNTKQLLSAVETDLARVQTELVRLQQHSASHDEASAKLRANIAAVEFRTVKDITDMELRDKEVRAGRELCDKLQADIQLQREEVERWKGEVVAWEEKSEERDRLVSRYVQDSAAARNQTATELESLQTKVNHSLEATQNLKVQLDNFKRQTETSPREGTLIIANNPDDQQMSRLKDLAFSSGGNQNVNYQSNYNLEPRFTTTNLSESNIGATSSASNDHDCELDLRNYKAHSSMSLNAPNSRLTGLRGERIIPDSQDELSFGNITTWRVANRAHKLDESLCIPDSQLETPPAAAVIPSLREDSESDPKLMHIAPADTEIWDQKMFDDMISSPKKSDSTFRSNNRLKIGSSRSDTLGKELIRPGRESSALQEPLISKTTTEQGSGATDNSIKHPNTSHGHSNSRKLRPKGILKKQNRDKIGNTQHTAYFPAPTPNPAAKQGTIKKALRRPSIPVSQYNRPVSGKEANDINSDPYNLPQSYFFGMDSNQKSQHARPIQQPQSLLASDSKYIPVSTKFEMPRSLRRTSSINAKRTLAWADATSERHSKVAKI